MSQYDPNDSGPGFLERLFTRPQTAFGGNPATTASPQAAAAWDRAMGEYASSGRQAAQAGRKRLSDQSRTEAYDPGADMFDPGNLRPVDFQGNTIWTNNYDYLNNPPPKPKAQPVTNSSSSKAITDAISKAIAATGGDWRQPDPDNRSIWAGAGQQPWDLPEFGPGAPPPGPTGPNWPQVDLTVPLSSYTQGDPRVATSGPRFRPGGPGVPPHIDRGGRSNSVRDAIDRWGRSTSIRDTALDYLHRLNGWNGKVYADGGPVGYADGGSFDSMPEFAPGAAPEPLDHELAHDTPTFIPMTAFGGGKQIGASQAVMPGPAPQLPMAGAGGSGKSGGGGGGLGSLLGPIGAIAGSFIPGVGTMIGGMAGSALGSMIKAEGGHINMMRGGYPGQFNAPPMPVQGLPQRHAFSTGGGEHYVRPDGRGNGRSDHIDASLSPGEFVMDAETTSMLGDGDNNAGARQFENLRQNIRKHKGRQLAKGKFSPKAKAPEQYMSQKLTASDRLAHDGMSDGLRARGRS